MAKSETRTIQGQHVLVNSVCQPASPRQNDFANSISVGFRPTLPLPVFGDPAEELSAPPPEAPRSRLVFKAPADGEPDVDPQLTPEEYRTLAAEGDPDDEPDEVVGVTLELPSPANTP